MTASVIELARHRTTATSIHTIPTPSNSAGIDCQIEAFQSLENSLQLAKFYARRGDFAAASRKTVQALQALQALRGLRDTSQTSATA